MPAPGETPTRTEDLNRALAAVEDFLLSLYVALRVFLASAQGVSVQPPFVRAFALLLVFVVLLRAVLVGRLRVTRSRLPFAILVYGLVLLGSALTSCHRAAGMDSALFAMEMVAVLCALSLSDNPHTRARLLLGVIAGAAAAVIVHGLFQKFVSLHEVSSYTRVHTGGIFSQPWGKERLLKGEPFGPFITSNILAGYLLFTVPMLLAAGWLSLRARIRKVEGGIAILVGVCGLYLMWTSGAKGAWAGLAAAIVLGDYVRRTRRIHAGMFWGVILAAVAGAGILAALSGPMSSMGIRGGYWLGGLKALVDRPLGIGAGAFDVVYPKYKPVWGMEVRSLHSAYFSALVEGGPILLVVFVFVVHRLFRAGGSSDPAQYAPVGYGAPQRERRLSLVTCGVGLAGGWLLSAAWFAAMDSAYAFKSLLQPSVKGLAKASFVLLGPLCALLVFRVFACLRPAGPSRGPEKDEAIGREVSSKGPMPGTLRLAYLVALAAIFVHAAADMLWETPAIALTVVLVAWCVERKEPHREVILAPYVRIATAGLGTVVLTLAAIRFVLIPAKAAGSLEEAEANAYIHQVNAQALVALEEIAAGSGSEAGRPGKAVDALLRAFKESDRGTVRRLVSEGRLAPIRQRLQTSLDLLAVVILQRTEEAVRRRPRDDRVAERAAATLLGAARVALKPSRLLTKAAQYCRQARDEVPVASRYHALSARILAEAGLHEQAFRSFNRAAEFNPTSPIRWLAAGDAAMLALKPLQATQCYQKALTLNFRTVEEKASLYALAYYPQLVSWPPARRLGEFHLALSALISVLSSEERTEVAAPFLFRAALEDLRLGDHKQARATFAQLGRFYVGDDGTSMRTFQWALALLRDPQDASLINTQKELEKRVPYPSMLEKIRRRAVEVEARQ